MISYGIVFSIMARFSTLFGAAGFGEISSTLSPTAAEGMSVRSMMIWSMDILPLTGASWP